MTVVAIIQARMTSSRLAGKVLADICGKPALQRMIDRVRGARLIDSIVVATTTNTTDDPVLRLCDAIGVAVYRGDESDVLGRIFEAARSASANAVVRLTADCPMIDPGVIDEIVTVFKQGDFDYVSNCDTRTYPDGLDVEICTFDALQQAHHEAKHAFAREHVTPYIRGSHPQFGDGKFRRKQVTFAADFAHVRWTLDTADDLKRIRRLVGSLPEGYTWLHALSLATKQPELLGVTL